MAFGKLLKGIGKAVGAVSRVGNIPIVGNVVKAIPGVGTAVSVIGAGAGVYNLLSGSGGGGASLPALPGGNMPALPGSAGAPPVVGQRGWFQNDPNIAAALQQWAISKANLRTAYRSPVKGYVIVRDVNGDAYALPKFLAKKYAGYKESKKPPISVGDWEAVKRADRTIKSVRKIMTTMVRVDKSVSNGKVKVKAKAK